MMSINKIWKEYIIMTRLIFNGKALRSVDGVISMPPVYDDWFLPSRDELNSMKNNVETEAGMVFGVYWCSTESNATEALYTASGSGSDAPKSNVYKVRPCRQFNAIEGLYSVKDQGPAGGWIFHVSGTFYMEAAPNDLDASVWSNVTNSLVGGTSVNIGTGLTNTNLIVNQSGHTNSAAQSCLDLIIYGSL